MLSYIGNKFIKFILKVRCTEFTTSYRVQFNELKNLELTDVKAKGYSFFMETIFLINKKGYLIKEIPIVFEDRTKGSSKYQK